jgi:predicted nuclease of predicted toxin-antitoxin system
LAEVRFHLDEHMPGAVARALRGIGIDVETTPDAGLLGAPDHVHLSHAHADGRVVVTDDSDFAGLHNHNQTHSGIAYFPGGRRSVGEIVEMLVLLHATYTAEEMVGRLEWL